MKKRELYLLAGALLCMALTGCGEGGGSSSAPEAEPPGQPLAVFEEALPKEQSLLDGYDYTWYYDGVFIDEDNDNGVYTFLTQDGQEMQFYLKTSTHGRDAPDGFGVDPLVYSDLEGWPPAFPSG